jgi:hypothetical protein
MRAWTGSWELQDFEAPGISRQLANEGIKVVSATQQAHLPPGYVFDIHLR